MSLNMLHSLQNYTVLEKNYDNVIKNTTLFRKYFII